MIDIYREKGSYRASKEFQEVIDRISEVITPLFQDCDTKNEMDIIFANIVQSMYSRECDVLISKMETMPF